MKKLPAIVLLIFLIVSPLASYGQYDTFEQSESDNNYAARAAQIRSEVWAWDIPAFRNYSVPDEYADESAVVLARHRAIDATAKKSNAARIFFLGDNTGKLFYTDIDRRMIKINDQAALDKFSEFSFKEESTHGMANLMLKVLGVRIIKPDGSIHEVDVSGASVSITEGKDDKEVYKKLAIPELQKGDILDWFICDVYELRSLNLSDQVIPFFTVDYPALSYSCQLVFGKNLTIEYRNINGAPVFSRETDEEGNIVLTAETDRLLRINDTENLRWISSRRDIPMMRFVVLQNKSAAFFKPKSARPIGVYENVPYEQILEDAKWFLAAYNFRAEMLKDTKKKVLETVANYRDACPESSIEELANIIYSALDFEWSGSPSFYNSHTFILMLDQLFKENGIESRIGFATNKYDARKDEIVTDDDLQLIILANGGKQLFFLPYQYMVPGEIPSGLQGEPATVFMLNKIVSNTSGKPIKIDTGPEELITLPQSTAQDNVHAIRIEASVLPEDSGKLMIRRHSSRSGAFKNEIQSSLISYENWDTTMRRYLHIDKSLIDELNEKRRTRKLVEKVEGNFEKAREEQEETMRQEIFAYHKAEPQKMVDYSVTSFGVTKDQPNLVYGITYVMDGFVRTAGDNLILDAGKLIGEQWVPTDNDRNRSINAYIPTPRMLEYKVSFNIPEGYKVGNIDHMNVDYSNKYMSFTANAVVEGNTISILAKKSYPITFVPKDDWGGLIEIIDKANRFYSSSIVLQKDR